MPTPTPIQESAPRAPATAAALRCDTAAMRCPTAKPTPVAKLPPTAKPSTIAKPGAASRSPAAKPSPTARRYPAAERPPTKPSPTAKRCPAAERFHTRSRSALCRLCGLLAALLGPAFACSSESATEADCEAILARIVELEVREQGYRDPVLLERKQATLRQSYAGEVQSCVGRRLPAGARECVAAASSAEEISHVCLR